MAGCSPALFLQLHQADAAFRASATSGTGLPARPLRLRQVLPQAEKIRARPTGGGLSLSTVPPASGVRQ